MRYHTVADGVRIAFDGDSETPTLTLASENGEPVTINPSQVGLIKLVRRGLTDLFDCANAREREREGKRQDREHE